MKEKDKDIDEVFRSRLYDFEADTMPGDWEAIVDRLPGRQSVPLRRSLPYWVAAAAVSLLVVTGGLLYVADREMYRSPVAQETPDIQVQPEESSAITPRNQSAIAAVTPVAKSGKRAASWSVEAMTLADEPAVIESVQVAAVNEVEADRPVESKNEPAKRLAKAAPVKQSRQQEAPKKQETATRKWGVGMGAGGLSVGSDNMVPQYVTNSTSLRSENLMLMNAPYFNNDLPKTDIHHKTPVSFGLSVSRYLNNRFSLQTGLTYSFLSSDWTTNGDYHGTTKQKLHFIGIPLSLSYKIAEWNRFNFYASAGAMAELNVAGVRSARLYNDREEMTRVSERVRMKELLWSVNAKGGVSYPVVRFVSAFAEVGAAYYFDNGSDIETIHSEKPFNVSLQFGFRLGF